MTLGIRICFYIISYCLLMFSLTVRFQSILAHVNTNWVILSSCNNIMYSTQRVKLCMKHAMQACIVVRRRGWSRILHFPVYRFTDGGEVVNLTGYAIYFKMYVAVNVSKHIQCNSVHEI
jgi:hypothetical protein